MRGYEDISTRHEYIWTPVNYNFASGLAAKHIKKRIMKILLTTKKIVFVIDRSDKTRTYLFTF